MQNHFVAVLPAVFDAPGFELRAGGQDDVGEHACGREEIILHDDELNFGFVAQNFSGAVHVGVLVDEAVGGDGIDQFDIILQARHAKNSLSGGQGLGAQTSLSPEKDGDVRSDRILSQRKNSPVRSTILRL